MHDMQSLTDRVELHYVPQKLTYPDRKLRCIISVKTMKYFADAESSVTNLDWLSKPYDGQRETSHTLGS